MIRPVLVADSDYRFDGSWDCMLVGCRGGVFLISKPDPEGDCTVACIMAEPSVLKAVEEWLECGDGDEDPINLGLEADTLAEELDGFLASLFPGAPEPLALTAPGGSS